MRGWRRFVGASITNIFPETVALCSLFFLLGQKNCYLNYFLFFQTTLPALNSSCCPERPAQQSEQLHSWHSSVCSLLLPSFLQQGKGIFLFCIWAVPCCILARAHIKGTEKQRKAWSCLSGSSHNQKCQSCLPSSLIPPLSPPDRVLTSTCVSLTPTSANSLCRDGLSHD